MTSLRAGALYRSLAIAVPLLLAAWLLVPPGSGKSRSLAQNGPPQVPCRVGLYRHLGPPALEPGELLNIDLRYRYDCRPVGEAETYNVMLVVGDSLPDFLDSKIELERDMRASLGTLINSITWAKSPRMGLIYYNDEVDLRSPLREGPTHYQALRQITKSFTIKRGGSLAFDAAIRAASDHLPPPTAGEANIIIIVDTGASPFSGVGEGCRAAGAAGTRLALLLPKGTPDQAAPCANAGVWTAGPGFTPALEERAEQLWDHVSGKVVDRPVLLRYQDTIDSDWFAFAPDPTLLPPTIISDTLSWEIPLRSLVESGGSLPYALEVIDPPTLPLPEIVLPSTHLVAELVFASGGRQPFDIKLPLVCIAQPGRRVEHCPDAGGFPPDATPTPTPTDWPSWPPPATPTSEPLASPTSSVTATPSVSGTTPASPTPTGSTSTPPPARLWLPLVETDS
jgi:hypothetical protein